MEGEPPGEPSSGSFSVHYDFSLEVSLVPKVTVEITAEEIKHLLLQLPPSERLELIEEVVEFSETSVMMQLAESGFKEWLEDGEDIYDAEA
jgi:hypothetical protein